MDGPASADASLTDLVKLALDRDEAAWSELVRRLERVVWKAVNLTSYDAQIRRDAAAATWLRLAERLSTIREPERLPGWLAITARRQALALMQGQRRVTLVGEVEIDVHVAPASDNEPETIAVGRDAVQVVRRALAELGEPCRELLTLLLLHDPPMSYAEVEELMDRPHGWIGPTKGRCIEKLLRVPSVAALSDGGRA